MKYKCPYCNRYIKFVPVKEPRVEGEVEPVCKKHGVLNGYEIIQE